MNDLRFPLCFQALQASSQRQTLMKTATHSPSRSIALKQCLFLSISKVILLQWVTMMKLLLILSILSATAMAQTCPVQVVRVYHTDGTFAGSLLHLIVKSNSDKAVTDTSVAVAVLDSTGELRVLGGSYGLGKTKPGAKKTKFYWVGKETLDPITHTDFLAWPTEVKFSDGSEWKDDGTRQCPYTEKKG